MRGFYSVRPLFAMLVQGYRGPLRPGDLMVANQTILVRPTDTTDTVFRGTPANKRNYRNSSLRLNLLVTT
jgi:hypothetical protein